MSKGTQFFIPGRVEFVEGNGVTSMPGEVGACRLKVRIESDGTRHVSELPWALPFPQNSILHVIPKVGEGVFIVNDNVGNPQSQRFYVGPIISQPQYMEYCAYDKKDKNGNLHGGEGPAMSLIDAAKPLTQKPLTSITRKRELTDGAFPRKDDIAIIGRGQEDIILKYKNNLNGNESEIDLRTGIRLEPTNLDIPYLKGNVVFNNVNPSYIQVKYCKNGVAGLRKATGDLDEEKYESINNRTANGVINIVSDKINLISHKDTNMTKETIADKEDLVKDGYLDEIMSKLHRAVYGDELVALLKEIVNAIATHTHPAPMRQAIITGTELDDMVNYNYEKILSPNVRIS